MRYDAAGGMNSITVSLVPFRFGLKLSRNLNQFPKLHVIPLFKSIVCCCCSFGESSPRWPQGESYGPSPEYGRKQNSCGDL